MERVHVGIAVTRIITLFVLLAGIASPCLYGADEASPGAGGANPPIEYTGLTKTLVFLLKSRAPSVIQVGSNRIQVESLFPDDTSELFDCDSAIYEYLESTDDPYYEALTERIKSSIYEKFEGREGSLFLHVEAAGDEDGMSIALYAHRSLLVSVPVELRAEDGSFGFSFTVLRPLEYEIGMELLVDAETVNSERYLEGLRLRIDTLSVQLGFDPKDEDYSEITEAEMDTPVRFTLEGSVDPARIVSCDLFSRSAWYFRGSPAVDSGTEEAADDEYEDEDEAEDQDAVPYSFLVEGLYSMDEATDSHFDLVMEVENGDPDTIFRYSVEDLQAIDPSGYLEFQ